MSEVAAQILDKMSPAQDTVVTPGGGASTDASPAPVTEQVAANANDKVSSKIEVLIKREQAARQLELQAKQRAHEVELRLKALEEREARLKEFESAKGSNSKKALELLGMSYDELTQSQLKDGEIPPEVHIKRIEERFNQFESAKEEEKRKQAEESRKAAEAREQQAITSFKSDITQYLDDNKARYELTHFENHQEMVFEVIDEHYKRTLAAAQKAFDAGEIPQEQVVGKVMKIEEAADKVEQYLEEKYNKSREVSKVKALWSAVPKDAIKNAAKPDTRPQQPRTLTNNLSAAHTPPKRTTPITDEERVQRAIAYAREKGFAP